MQRQPTGRREARATISRKQFDPRALSKSHDWKLWKQQKKLSRCVNVSINQSFIHRLSVLPIDYAWPNIQLIKTTVGVNKWTFTISWGMKLLKEDPLLSDLKKTKKRKREPPLTPRGPAKKETRKIRKGVTPRPTGKETKNAVLGNFSRFFFQIRSFRAWAVGRVG